MKQVTGKSIGHFCFLFTLDFRVEEEKLVDKLLCLFGEKQIEGTLKPNKNSNNKNKAKPTQQMQQNI